MFITSMYTKVKVQQMYNCGANIEMIILYHVFVKKFLEDLNKEMAFEMMNNESRIE